MSIITNGFIRHAGRAREAPLDSDLVTGLLRPEAYPHPVDRVELVETHISWVLLAGEFAYKVKKPVDLGFLDFRKLERRRFFCEEELRLNRFWAPELYLGVVPIGMREGHPRVGDNGSAVEYAVRMRQFDQALRLDHQLEAGRLTRNDMLELAAEIAARHQAAARAGPPGRLLLATKRLMWDNFDDLIGEVALASPRGSGAPPLHKYRRDFGQRWFLSRHAPRCYTSGLIDLDQGNDPTTGLK